MTTRTVALSRTNWSNGQVLWAGDLNDTLNSTVITSADLTDLQVDSCDATTGWSDNVNMTSATETTMCIEGAAALRLTKDNTVLPTQTQKKQ